MTNIAIIVGLTRTGTTVLAELLKSTDRFLSFGEVFNVQDEGNFFAWIEERTKSGNNPIVNDTVKLFREYLQSLVARANAESKILLMDIKYEQFHHVHEEWESISFPHQIFTKVLREFQPLILHTQRKKDYLRVVSSEVASVTGVYHVRQGNEHIEWAKSKVGMLNEINLSTEFIRSRVIDDVRDKQWTTQLIREQGLHQEIVVYEEMFDQSGQRFREDLLCRLSEVFSIPVEKFNAEPRLQKVSSFSMSLVQDKVKELEAYFESINQFF